MLSVSTNPGELEMFGITDPWIWAAYAGCFATVVFCCLYGWKKKDGDE